MARRRTGSSRNDDWRLFEDDRPVDGGSSGAGSSSTRSKKKAGDRTRRDAGDGRSRKGDAERAQRRRRLIRGARARAVSVTPPIPTPGEIVSALDRTVIGQARAKRDLAVAVYRHHIGARAVAANDLRRDEVDRQHLLLIGPTGCGKTHLVRTLASIVDMPIVSAAATGFSEIGYVGDHVETLVTRLVEACDWDVERAERGIIFLDEIDKLRRRPGGVRDVSGEGVQAGLLTLLDGERHVVRRGDREVAIDLSKILFLCCGAFVDLAPIVRARLAEMEGDSFGFAARGERGSRDEIREASDDAIVERVETVDIERFGLLPELIGRFAAITTMRTPARGDLRRILTDAEGSALVRERAMCRLHGIELRVEDDALDAIADDALRRRTGARGLRAALRRALASIDARLPELAERRARVVTVTDAVVREGAEPMVEFDRPPSEAPPRGPRARAVDEPPATRLRRGHSDDSPDTETVAPFDDECPF